MSLRNRLPSQSPRRGVTLLEAVLAMTLGAMFLGAFLAMFGVQRANFQAAEDETTLPAIGQSLLSSMFGGSGLLDATTSAGALVFTPSTLTLSMGGANTRTLAFAPDPNDPPGCLQMTPPSCMGTITVQDSGGSATPLAGTDAVATMSFYVPDLISNPGQITYPMTTLNGAVVAGAASIVVASSTGISAGQTLWLDSGPLADPVIVSSVAGTTLNLSQKPGFNHLSGVAVGPPAFYILGATFNPGDLVPNTTLTLGYSRSSTGTWTFQYPFGGAAVEQSTFAPGALFTLDGESGQRGKLICAFPVAEPSTTAFGPDSIGTFTLFSPTTTAMRQVGVWLQLNGGPQSGLEILHDELFLSA